MTQVSNGNVVEVQPGPTVYTVLIIITILAQILAIGFVGYRLMSDSPSGYGMSAGQMFDSFEEHKTEVDRQGGTASRSARNR